MLCETVRVNCVGKFSALRQSRSDNVQSPLIAAIWFKPYRESKVQQLRETIAENIVSVRCKVFVLLTMTAYGNLILKI